MRRYLSLLAVVLILSAAATATMAETTKTLKLDHALGAGEKVVIENLAGSMKVVPGGGDRIVAVATLHAESDALAAKVEFVNVGTEKGRTVLRVRYPVEEHDVFRYPGRGDAVASFLGIFGGSGSSVDYEGHRVRVSGNRGVLLYADVEVRMPRGSADAAFRNLVGPIGAEDLEGSLAFDTASGTVTLDRLRGRISADTGSGEIKASSLAGSFSGDTGSGDISVVRFDGEEVRCDTGSGDVEVSGAKARIVEASTGSGGVSVLESDIESFRAETGSGDIRLEATGARLGSVEADTGSGEVRISLPPQATFEATADQGSGEIHSGFADAQPIVQGKHVVGYRRGDGRIRIRVETGSGELRLEAAR